MLDQSKSLIESHVKTHSERSAQDEAAVSTLEFFFRSNGRINTLFASGDKWPNTDGTFEYVADPDVSRRPKQNFFVQIKGSHSYKENNGIIKYSLQSLGFPATMAMDVTLDPGILFVVLDPDERGSERVFWKYMSVDYINTIDFTNGSTTVVFESSEEIYNTDESIIEFCKKLDRIIEHHLFVNKLSSTQFNLEDIKKIVKACDKSIVRSIDTIESLGATRDEVSQEILPRLNDLCISVLLQNSNNHGCTKPNLQLAYEQAQLDLSTKYLANFLRGLKYIDHRIPEEGQSERLMLKYYNFMWQIRKYFWENNRISILQNLEKFPLNTDKLDNEYYRLVADTIESTDLSTRSMGATRFYIQKKTPFYVGTERYYEITLQLANQYATKFNRITVYSKQNISTRYSINIGYADTTIALWGIASNIKIVTNWRVSVAPTCLNKLGKILNIPLKMNSSYGEYTELMNFLTKTGMTLLDLIDLQEIDFQLIIEQIYEKSKTEYFRKVIELLRREYSSDSKIYGKNVVRYLLINLREKQLIDVMPNRFKKSLANTPLYLANGCRPFERNPLLANLPGSKTTEANITQILSASGTEKINILMPYLKIRNAIRNTGEMYFKTSEIASEKAIENYNEYLVEWEQDQGYSIINESGLVTISVYERITLKILQALMGFAKTGIKGQKELNAKFIKDHKSLFENVDISKQNTIKYAFVNSRLLLIYGAAGTGKTTLINYISNLMPKSKKLFLTKTHTAIQHLNRRIENPGSKSDFVCIDSFTRKVNLPDYDIVFVDECSTIDNRTMLNFISKISSDSLIVLAGDINQIESIDFGNWFYYAKNIITTQGSNVELLDTWRTKEENLLSLWEEVRNNDVRITEKLVIDGPFSKEIGSDIFESNVTDEVVLCLNYDGKFGLNNINSYFQDANPNGEAVIWNEWRFKKGDRIIFNDNSRFTYLYNNLKGVIVDIEKTDVQIAFTIDVETIITDQQCKSDHIEYIDTIDEKTRIRLIVYAFDEDEIDNEEDSKKTVIPFQLAYAVSIHKAQGLEYDSVKVVIPNVNSEKITKGVFYTAITRTKRKLTIYWSSETMEKIISGFSSEPNGFKSLEIIKNKLTQSE
ncbi:MAG: AAA family ATPase [Ruminococcus sp.]|nr:AAA family ATPase [Ruminococcus sp.]